MCGEGEESQGPDLYTSAQVLMMSQRLTLVGVSY